MSPYAAYILGLFTLIAIILPFWVLSMRYQGVSDAYKAVFCDQAI